MASSNPGCAPSCTDIYFQVTDIDTATGIATADILEFSCSGGLPGGETSGIEIFPLADTPFFKGMRGWAKLAQKPDDADCHWRATMVEEGPITIRFSIVAPLNSLPDPCSVLVYILSRPHGMTTVPEEYGGTVFVQDMVGCFLCAPAEDLVGMGGYAVYMDADPTNAAPPGDVMPPGVGVCPGTPTPRWEIIALCCRQGSCDS